LLTFSSQEIQKSHAASFIDRAFGEDWSYTGRKEESWTEVMRRASFPELLNFSDPAVLYEWCNGYMNTILQRDVRLLLEIEKIAALPDLLRLMASRTGGLLNEASLTRDCELNHITLKKYRILLENLFLTLSIPAWSLNPGKRLVKSPKIYISDLNLLAYLNNIDMNNLPGLDRKLFGSFLENFVAVELTKQLTFSKIRARLYHYRTTSGQEVDFILEGPENTVAAIEVKSAAKVTAHDFRHLEALRNDIGNKFKRGFVFYQGSQIVPFGSDLWAIPFSSLWQ
ncbi:MAG: ATP-binding protein, partial [Candidatus Rifleibacteriota bacterium]